MNVDFDAVGASDVGLIPTTSTRYSCMRIRRRTLSLPHTRYFNSTFHPFILLFPSLKKAVTVWNNLECHSINISSLKCFTRLFLFYVIWQNNFLLARNFARTNIYLGFTVYISLLVFNDLLCLQVRFIILAATVPLDYTKLLC